MLAPEAATVDDLARGDLVVLDPIYGIEQVADIYEHPDYVALEVLITPTGTSRHVARFPHEPVIRMRST